MGFEQIIISGKSFSGGEDGLEVGDGETKVREANYKAGVWEGI